MQVIDNFYEFSKIFINYKLNEKLLSSSQALMNLFTNSNNYWNALEKLKQNEIFSRPIIF